MATSFKGIHLCLPKRPQPTTSELEDASKAS